MKHYKKRITDIFRKVLITVLVVATFSSSIISQSVHAQASAQCDEKFYSSNDVLLYNPCETTCSPQQVSVTGDSSKLSNVDNIKTVYTFLTSTPLSSNNNQPLNPVQASGAIGNMYEESGGMNPAAIEGGSGAGHGLAQWSFGRWTNLSNFATQQGKQWTDINLQLQFLKGELEGPEQAILKDPEFASTTDPASATMRWRIVFERANAQLAHDDTRISAATAVYTMFGGTSASCQSGNFAVAGDLVKTAINLALTSPASNGMTQQSQARESYQQAKPQYNPKVDWTDCGGFIATAMYASGVDKNYPNVNVSTQLNYVKSHPEKYSINTHPTMSDLQPGDILYVDGHTTLYTGENPYPMVDASLGDRVPSVRPPAALQWMLSQSSITSARLVK